MKKKRIHNAAFLLSLLAVMVCNIIDLRSTQAKEKRQAQLYLVGVGPGDPDHATLQAIKVINESDLIVCSRGVKERFGIYVKNKEVIEAPPGLWRCYEQSPTTSAQRARTDLNELRKALDRVINNMRQAIKQQKTVAVLSSGDPLLYGPWKWCLEEFSDLSPVVIPGLSCFNAASAALKKDPTHAPYTKSVILTAGDLPAETDTIDRLATHKTSMIFFTMNIDLADLVKKLSGHYSPRTPVAIVIDAGYKDSERVLHGTLQNIESKIANNGHSLKAFNYLFYVGDFLSHSLKANR